MGVGTEEGHEFIKKMKRITRIGERERTGETVTPTYVSNDNLR